MSRLRPPDVGDRRHDPASLQAAAADLVLGGAPVGNPLQRYVGTAAVGPAWRHLQDRLASGAEASPRDDRSGSFASGRRGRIRPSEIPFRTKEAFFDPAKAAKIVIASAVEGIDQATN